MSDGSRMALDRYFTEVIDIATGAEPMSPTELMAKTIEELGEVSEHLLFAAGHVQHKTLDEPIQNEFGDVMNCVVAMTAKALKQKHPELTNDQIKSLLVDGMLTKITKYFKLVHSHEQS